MSLRAAVRRVAAKQFIEARAAWQSPTLRKRHLHRVWSLTMPGSAGVASSVFLVMT